MSSMSLTSTGVTSAQLKTGLNIGLSMVVGVIQIALIGGFVQTPQGVKRLIALGMLVGMVQLAAAHKTVPDGYVSQSMVNWLNMQNLGQNVEASRTGTNSGNYVIQPSAPVVWTEQNNPTSTPPGVMQAELSNQFAAKLAAEIKAGTARFELPQQPPGRVSGSK